MMKLILHHHLRSTPAAATSHAGTSFTVSDLYKADQSAESQDTAELD